MTGIGDFSIKYYGMEGQEIPKAEAYALMEDSAGRRVAETHLPGGVWISTVLLVHDHAFDGGRPLIFETMVFESRDNLSDLDMNRYHTKEEALAGHEAMVTKWTGWTPGDPEPEEVTS